MAVRRRFLHPVWLLVSLPGYVGFRLLPALDLGTAGTLAGALLLLGFSLFIPLALQLQGLKNRTLADRLAWVGFIGMGFFSTLFVMTVVRDLFLLATALLTSMRRSAAVATSSAHWTLGLTALFVFIGLLIARRPRLVEVDVPVANLPSALQGFSIAQITDLHVGPTIKRQFVEGIVARVNALNADMIALTGDLVDGSVPELSPHTAPLASLTSRHGAYFVTGNHEYYSGEGAWSAEFARLGMTVLKNRHVVLRHDGAQLVLAGITDFGAHHFDVAQRSDPVLALHGAPSDAGVRVLLAHQPSSAPAAADAGFDVQISGHTHGGQFWPWNFFVRYFQPFTHGLHRLRNLRVYVSRGTGYWGPPNRFVVPGEITRLRLVRALTRSGRGSSR